jgi:hypothetical protein
MKYWNIPLIGLLALLAVAACGSQPARVASQRPAAIHQSTTPSPAATAAATPTPAPSVAGAAPTPDRCHTAGLAVANAGMDGAAGTIYLTFVLTNTGTAPCSLYGFVGMQMLNAAGRPLPTDVVRTGVAGTPAGPTQFLLDPGSAANFQADYNHATLGGPESICPTAAKLEITPPDEFDHLTIPVDMDPCLGHINVTPVRPPGALGSAG